MKRTNGIWREMMRCGKRGWCTSAGDLLCAKKLIKKSLLNFSSPLFIPSAHKCLVCLHPLAGTLSMFYVPPFTTTLPWCFSVCPLCCHWCPRLAVLGSSKVNYYQRCRPRSLHTRDKFTNFRYSRAENQKKPTQIHQKAESDNRKWTRAEQKKKKLY